MLLGVPLRRLPGRRGCPSGCGRVFACGPGPVSALASAGDGAPRGRVLARRRRKVVMAALSATCGSPLVKGTSCADALRCGSGLSVRACRGNIEVAGEAEGRCAREMVVDR